jgi:hypothetical protein
MSEAVPKREYSSALEPPNCFVSHIERISHFERSMPLDNLGLLYCRMEFLICVSRVTSFLTLARLTLSFLPHYEEMTAPHPTLQDRHALKARHGICAAVMSTVIRMRGVFVMVPGLRSGQTPSRNQQCLTKPRRG